MSHFFFYFFLFLSLLDKFVQNDQSTAAVSVTYVARRGGGTDVDMSLRVYFSSRAGGCTNVFKCLKTFFQGGKSGRVN